MITLIRKKWHIRNERDDKCLRLFGKRYEGKAPLGIIRHRWEDIRSSDSIVGIATGYGFDDQGVRVRVPAGSRIFSFPRRPDWPGVHPTSYPMGTGGSFPGGKTAGA
jgi:hypothetical protein